METWYAHLVTTDMDQLARWIALTGMEPLVDIQKYHARKLVSLDNGTALFQTVHVSRFTSKTCLGPSPVFFLFSYWPLQGISFLTVLLCLFWCSSSLVVHWCFHMGRLLCHYLFLISPFLVLRESCDSWLFHYLSYFLLDHWTNYGCFENQISPQPDLGAYAASQSTVLHMKRLNQTEPPISMILCVLCF